MGPVTTAVFDDTCGNLIQKRATGQAERRSDRLSDKPPDRWKKRQPCGVT